MKTVLVIDEDSDFRDAVVFWLRRRGWRTLQAQDDQAGLEMAHQHRPEVVVFDLGLANGAQFCRTYRGREETARAPAVLIVTGRGGANERIHALESGADEYLAKPLNYDRLWQILSRSGGDPAPQAPVEDAAFAGARLKFWGVRGSTPSPGAEKIFYGGNTSCVEVRCGADIIILDAGTGIRKLGLALAAEFDDRPINLKVLVTHTHWDHIQGFPFFLPGYDPKNIVTIYGFEGARHGLESTLSSQMESPYFPISMRQMPGHITIEEVKEMNFNVGSVPVQAQFLDHPGLCVGYRLFTTGGSISYLPDVELFRRGRSGPHSDTDLLLPEPSPMPAEQDHKLVEFVRGSDVLILDAQYNAAEYQSHVGWGHSCVDDSVKFAVEAQVRRLFLFHHDPDHNDEQISRMVAGARQLAVRCGSPLIVQAAQEGLELVLEPKKSKVP
jgi:phosphoribosyl 1,2-cyclic phosphodiesterase/ActR/RegA family two-component response regulator